MAKGCVVSGTSYTAAGRVGVGGEDSITLAEVSQASPVRPSGTSSIR